jgi:hypothetical protein
MRIVRWAGLLVLAVVVSAVASPVARPRRARTGNWFPEPNDSAA